MPALIQLNLSFLLILGHLLQRFKLAPMSRNLLLIIILLLLQKIILFLNLIQPSLGDLQLPLLIETGLLGLPDLLLQPLNNLPILVPLGHRLLKLAGNLPILLILLHKDPLPVLGQIPDPLQVLGQGPIPFLLLLDSGGQQQLLLATVEQLGLVVLAF
jgi:hypothetical protein